MPLSTNNNIMALNVGRSISKTIIRHEREMETVGSGLRITRAENDAAGLTISEGFRSQLTRLGQNVRNAEQARDGSATRGGRVSAHSQRHPAAHAGFTRPRLTADFVDPAETVLHDRQREGLQARHVTGEYGGDGKRLQLLACVAEQATAAAVDVEDLIQVRIEQQDGVVRVIEDVAEACFAVLGALAKRVDRLLLTVLCRLQIGDPATQLLHLDGGFRGLSGHRLDSV